MSKMDLIWADLMEFESAIKPDVRGFNRTWSGAAQLKSATRALGRLLMLAKSLREDAEAEAVFEDELMRLVPLLRTDASMVRVIQAAMAFDDLVRDELDKCVPAPVRDRRKALILERVSHGR